MLPFSLRSISLPQDLPALNHFLSREDQDRAAQLEPAVAAGDALVWVAEQDGVLLGWAVAHLTFRADLGWEIDPDTLSFQTGENVYLEHLRVAESHRNQGIGKPLLKAIEQECHRREKRRLWLHTGETNVLAQRFYEREGWTVEKTVWPHWNGGAPMRVYCKQIERQEKTASWSKGEAL